MEDRFTKQAFFIPNKLTSLLTIICYKIKYNFILWIMFENILIIGCRKDCSAIFAPYLHYIHIIFLGHHTQSKTHLILPFVIGFSAPFT
jgi:hypothetical protein